MVTLSVSGGSEVEPSGTRILLEISLSTKEYASCEETKLEPVYLAPKRRFDTVKPTPSTRALASPPIPS